MPAPDYERFERMLKIADQILELVGCEEGVWSVEQFSERLGRKKIEVGEAMMFLISCGYLMKAAK